MAGAELGGLLPTEIQNYTVFAGAIVANAKQPAAGKALLEFLAAPGTIKVMKAKASSPRVERPNNHLRVSPQQEEAMTSAMRAATTAFAVMLAFGISAHAAEIKVLSSNALKSALEEIAPQFEKASGHKLMMVWGAAVPLRGQIEKGEVFDATILNTPGIDALISQGKLDGATRTPLVRSSIGVAVRKGAPKPDISTTEAFKTALRNAKSITYVEQGASGIYLKDLFVKLGIADEIKSKVKLAPTAAAEFVAKGEAEIGMTQISEILPFAGADLVGPLPADIQLYTSFAGANSAATKQPDAGRAFFKFLVTPDTAKVMKAKGLEPAS